MKLPYPRCLLLAPRIPRHYRETAFPNSSVLSLSRTPRRSCLPAQQQWHPHRRTVATNAAAKLNDFPVVSREKELEEKASLSDQVRVHMRQVPHPVAIITATDCSNSNNGQKAFRGMTVSSFNTVTLYPEPVISFNVKRPSETLNALQASGRFLVHLLAPSAATAKLARDFSKGNANLHISSGEGEFEFSSSGSATDEAGAPAPPLLRRRRLEESSESQTVDFPFVFECRLIPQKIEVQDHTIVLGTVVRVLEQPRPDRADSTGDGHSPEDLCLTYADTRFWRMGENV